MSTSYQLHNFIIFLGFKLSFVPSRESVTDEICDSRIIVFKVFKVIRRTFKIFTETQIRPPLSISLVPERRTADGGLRGRRGFHGQFPSDLSSKVQEICHGLYFPIWVHTHIHTHTHIHIHTPIPHSTPHPKPYTLYTLHTLHSTHPAHLHQRSSTPDSAVPSPSDSHQHPWAYSTLAADAVSVLPPSRSSWC